jgi:predicted DNA-binding transcriptional regulator AlpA
MDRLLTTEQVGQALGYTADWVRRRCTDGTFPYIQDGPKGRVMLRERDVQAWIDANVRQEVRVEATHTTNTVVAAINQKRRERGRQRKAS